MDNKESMQNTLKTLEERWQNINQILDKGNDTVVLQIGSVNIRYGFGSQWKPGVIRNQIAYKIQKSQYQEQEVDSDEVIQDGDDRIEQLLQSLESQLRKRGNIKQDYKNYKIKQKAKQEIRLEEDNDYELDQQIVIGDQCEILDIKKYKVRQPIKQQNYNLLDYENIQQCIQDLLKILEFILRDKMGIKQCGQYSIILVINDSFSKGFIRSLINIMLQDLGFRQLYCHLESVCGCFGSCIQYGCVVNIGYQKTTVVCVEEGVELPSTLVSRNYGSKQVEMALDKLLRKKKVLKDQVDYSRVLRLLKQNVCSTQQLEDLSNKTYRVGRAESEIIVNYSDAFCVASNVLFDNNCLEILMNTQDNNNQQKAEQQLNQIFNEYEGMVDDSNVISLDELICWSVSRIPDVDARKKMANNILLIGGGSQLRALSDELQDRVIDKIHLFDSTVEHIDCIDVSSKEVIPSDVSWAGATILSKIEGLKDLWITRSKYLGEIDNSLYEEEDNKKSQEIVGIKALREKLPFQW